MAFRSIIITKPCKISSDKKSIKIENDEGVFHLPAEDINALILENLQCSISGHALSLLSQNKSVTFVCNQLHVPVGILQNFQSHSTQLIRIQDQISVSQPFKNKIWQKIIKQKIINQSIVLSLNDNVISNTLVSISDRVTSNDKENAEGYAANIYFKQLFGANFSREKDCIHNACLNYGYTILRGFVARSLVSYGFIPSLGIHHQNQYNNYNLADDFIEPFRPIVDLWVKKNIKETDKFNSAIKHMIADIVNYDILIQNKKCSVSNGMDITISSYVSSIKKKDFNELLLPTILPLTLHKYE